MTETPIRVEPDAVNAEPRKTGTKWLDLLLAASAILISTVSLFIASEHGKTQERLVAATSWPFLQFRTSNDDQGKNVVQMEVVNSGQGPALLKYLGVTYEGHPVHNSAELIALCCNLVIDAATAKDTRIQTTIAEGVVIAPHDTNAFFRFEKPQSHPEAWDAMDRARWKLKFDACYCSVLKECWRSDLHGLEPTPVKSCPTEGGYIH